MDVDKRCHHIVFGHSGTITMANAFSASILSKTSDMRGNEHGDITRQLEEDIAPKAHSGGATESRSRRQSMTKQRRRGHEEHDKVPPSVTMEIVYSSET